MFTVRNPRLLRVTRHSPLFLKEEISYRVDFSRGHTKGANEPVLWLRTRILKRIVFWMLSAVIR